MPSTEMTTKAGPKTFIPAELIQGSQVVEARSNSRVGVGSAGSLKTVGIAITDGIQPEALTSDPTTVAGIGLLDATARKPYVVVAYAGIEVPRVTYAAPAAFGDRLKAANAGKVTPMATGDDPRLEVGTCTEPAGVATNGTGAVRTK